MLTGNNSIPHPAFFTIGTTYRTFAGIVNRFTKVQGEAKRDNLGIQLVVECSSGGNNIIDGTAWSKGVKDIPYVKPDNPLVFYDLFLQPRVNHAGGYEYKLPVQAP